MNNLLILIILSIILFFILDIIHNKYIKNKINEKFQNIEGSYEKFKSLSYENFEDNDNNSTETTTTTKVPSNDDIRELYYKQYIYKILSANDKDQIIKLNLTNSENEINLDFIFNNVLDHEKINELDNNIAIIKDYNNLENNTVYNIDNQDCDYEDTDNHDNDDYRWNIKNITDSSFTLLFTNLNDNTKTYTITIKLKDGNTLQSLYSQNISFKEMLSSTILSDGNGITLSTPSNTNIDITSYYVNQIIFSNFTIKRLGNYHKIMSDTIEQQLLKPANDNIKEMAKIQKNIDKLENYYRFKKSMDTTYSKYKTL